MTTDWKALCAELVHGWTEGRDIAGPMANARAALAQPEPEGPTDEELLAIAIESELVASNGTNPFREDSDIEDEVMQFARAVLARWGRPAVEPETNGKT